MPIYLYRCEEHGDIESLDRGDAILCPECHHKAKRYWKLHVDAESARHKGRFDPIVGQYVSSEREFRSLLAQGQARESASLGMDVKLATVDARDQEGLAELHGHKLADRQADLEATKRAKHDRKVANK